MFGIFQADLPVGRAIWLVALTLIVTSLISGAPLNLPSDSVAFAIAMLVYSGHSFVLGFLFSFLPKLIVLIADWYLLFKTSRSWDRTAILFEHPRCDLLRDIIDNVGIVCAAALAARRFGQPSLYMSGVFGLSCILLAEILDIPAVRKIVKGGLPLLELRSVGNAKSIARIFSSGKLLSETPLDEDFGSALAHLLNAKWTLDPDLSLNSESSAWLRKRTTKDRLRKIATATEHSDVWSWLGSD